MIIAGLAAVGPGSALMGAAAGLGPRPVIVIGAGVTLVCVAIEACDRARTGVVAQ